MATAQDIKGRIFNIQKYSIYDGDGIRTLIFLKGCNLRCPWCSNPEGLVAEFQVMHSPEKCVDCGRCAEVCPTELHTRISDGNGGLRHHLDRSKNCIGCRRCEEACIGDALAIVGRDVSVAEMMEVIMQDYDFYLASGGGVTLGGGEMSLQTDFAVALLGECKKMMINTAIETQGTTDLANYRRLAAVTDTFLFDLKQIDGRLHQQMLGIGNDGVLRNLEWLVDNGAHVVVRMPLIRGYNDSWEAITGAIDYVRALAERGNVSRIDMLPYHQLGRKKYQRLGMIYPIADDPSYSQDELNQLETFFRGFDFDIRLVRH